MLAINDEFWGARITHKNREHHWHRMIIKDVYRSVRKGVAAWAGFMNFGMQESG